MIIFLRITKLKQLLVIFIVCDSLVLFVYILFIYILLLNVLF